MYFPCVLDKAENGEIIGVYCIQIDQSKNAYTKKYMLYDEFCTCVKDGLIWGCTIEDGDALVEVDFDLDKMTSYVDGEVTQIGLIVIGAQWVRGKALTKVCYIDETCKVRVAYEETLVNEVQQHSFNLVNAKIRKASGGFVLRWSDKEQFALYNVYGVFDVGFKVGKDFLDLYAQLQILESCVEQLSVSDLQSLKDCECELISITERIAGLEELVLQRPNIWRHFKGCKSRLETENKHELERVLKEEHPLFKLVSDAEVEEYLKARLHSRKIDYALRCVICVNSEIELVRGGTYEAKCPYCYTFYLRQGDVLVPATDSVKTEHSLRMLNMAKLERELIRERLYTLKLNSLREDFLETNRNRIQHSALLNIIKYFKLSMDNLKLTK